MNENTPVYGEIAARLRGLRDAIDLTTTEMAQRVDMPEQSVIDYESGAMDIPVSYLFSVAKAFNLDPTVLMSGDESRLHSYSLVKKDNVMAVERHKAYDYHSLAHRFSNRTMEPFRVIVPPKPKEELTFNDHPGQEFIHMLSGRLEVSLGKEVLVMEPGDSLYFNSHIPHAMRGLDEQEAVFLDVLA
jgi:transcriptional regulator with XRE-family HTH domain